jgi:Sulfotransferase domain
MGSRLNILTHHKCATTWTVRYLSEFCVLNSMNLASTHYSNLILDRWSNLNIYTNASYQFISLKIDEGVHIIRNPLDILVSAYYSHRNTHSLDGWPELKDQRKILRDVNYSDGVFLTLAFLERDDFYDGAVGPLHALRRWNYDDQRFLTVRMEDVVSNPEVVMGSILKARFSESILPSVDNHTFQAVSGRKIGNIDDRSHYRSGKANQWKELLPDAIISYIRAHFTTVLEKFYPDSLLTGPSERNL